MNKVSFSKAIRLIASLAVSMAFACGGEADHQEEYAESVTRWDPANEGVPGQEGRLDGSVWVDGLFNSSTAKEEFCTGEGAGAWFCDVEVPSIGNAEVDKAWASAEYHGMAKDSAGTCYGAAQAMNGSNDCIFPQLKQLRVKTDPACTADVKNQAIMTGIFEGMRKWVGIDTVDVVADGAPGTSWYMLVPMKCSLTTVDVTAEGGLGGQLSTRVCNAPIGPHSGRDIDDLQVINGGLMNVNLAEVKADCKFRCNGPFGAACSADQLRAFSRAVGTHEGGHIFGFSHFNGGGSLNANVMWPFTSSTTCIETPLINGEYQAALGIYNSGHNLGTVEDFNLEIRSPE
jgi:hypothetical protein